MGDTITIEGVHGYNGEYPLDVTSFTNRELHFIKEITGLRSGEFQDAFTSGDNDLLVAFAAIAIWRKRDERPNVEAIWDAPAGRFTINMETPEEEADDESIPLPTEDAPDETETESPSETGETSNGSLDSPESLLVPTGFRV